MGISLASLCVDFVRTRGVLEGVRDGETQTIRVRLDLRPKWALVLVRPSSKERKKNIIGSVWFSSWAKRPNGSRRPI